MPVIMAGLDHRTEWRLQVQFLDKVFSMPVLCYECLGPDSALHSLAFPQLQFFTVVDFPVAVQRPIPCRP